MEHTPIFSSEAAVGRRRFIGYGVSGALVFFGVAACSDMKSTPRDPNDKPFWEREEQRD